MSVPASESARLLQQIVSEVTPRLRALDENAAGRSVGGKWSPKEVLGHLIDSASNNHQRFVRAALSDELFFPGYDQDAWVALQRYSQTPWDELMTLWSSFNLQLSRVMSAIPESSANLVRVRHNLEKIAWSSLPAGQPATLAWFMRDYVGHLEHHLGQILNDYVPRR